MSISKATRSMPTWVSVSPTNMRTPPKPRSWRSPPCAPRRPSATPCSTASMRVSSPMPQPVTALFRAPGRVVLVTGASGGLGQALLPVLVAGGAQVAACHFGAAPGDAAEGVAWFRLDVSDEDDVRAVVRDVRARFGRIDHVVHLAGVVGRGPLVDVSLDDWNRLLA